MLQLRPGAARSLLFIIIFKLLYLNTIIQYLILFIKQVFSVTYNTYYYKHYVYCRYIMLII